MRQGRVILLFILSVLGFALLSPKWNFTFSAWIAPAALLLLGSGQRFWRSFLLTLVTLFISGLIANYRVMPFPALFLVPFCLQIAVVNSIPYVAATFLSRYLDGSLSTLAFPSLAVLVEFLSSLGGGGVWGSIANTQAGNLALMQLTSVFGLWGVSFLLYWWAALLEWAYRRRSWRLARIPFALYFVVLAAAFLFGQIRLMMNPELQGNSVKVAAVSAMNIHALFQIYEDAFGKKMEVNAAALTQTSPEITELNKGLVVFIENPSDTKFRHAFAALDAFQDSLFDEAAVHARAGAKLIVFSEALMLTIKSKELQVIEKARQFSRKNRVRLVLTLGSFLPGKVDFGKKYIENKAISINEHGEIENVFFKNKPVPIVEGSVPGDGEIPVMQTDIGRIATSICYDADFPPLMRKAGKKNADLLVLPSGDWPEVSPFHAEMAKIRAIENGFALLRPVSNARSIACDAYGRIVASKEFSKKGITSLIVDLPLNGAPTIYTSLGDILPVVCGLVIVMIAATIYLKRKNESHRRVEESAG